MEETRCYNCDRMATDGLCDRLGTCDPFGVVVAKRC